MFKGTVGAFGDVGEDVLDVLNGEEKVRPLPPNGDVHFLDSDKNLPEMPRRRETIWSFQVAHKRSIDGMTDCVVSSRTSDRTAAASDS